MEDQDTYGIGDTGSTRPISPPEVSYKPPVPKSYAPGIGIVGCGGISEQHFTAYRKHGWNIVAVCNIHREKAEAARDRFAPDARVYEDWKDMVKDPDIEVVDLTVHPEVRDEMFEPFIDAGKHILSQKPFVTNIARGEELAAKASAADVKLAVNQNGRWSPHYGYIGGLVDRGYLGKIQAVRHSISWDHSWTKGTPFEGIHFLILYDFGIHWFDMISRLMKGREAKSVYAIAGEAIGQDAKPPFLSSVLIEFEGAQASIDFNAATRFGQEDRTIVLGTAGTALSAGTDLNSQSVVYSCRDGIARPVLEGAWFPDGFAGTMGELLCSIEEDRVASNNAADNLNSLRLCFAALRSAREGRSVNPNEPGLEVIK